MLREPENGAQMQTKVISRVVAANMGNASFIREMFERGRRMKAEYGEQNVFDFSIGNPNATPPPEYYAAVDAVAVDRRPELSRYMPNPGFEETRRAVAAFLSDEYAVSFDTGSIVMTSGAAGGLNVALRTICEPGDKVIVPAPFFPEYRFYIQQAGAEMTLVPNNADFELDLPGIDKALASGARAVIFNSPANPTGVCYTEATVAGLIEVLQRHDRPDRPVYLLIDDPYRRLVFDMRRAATPLGRYPRTLLISSYSKDLSIPGERAGYIAVPQSVEERGVLLAALSMINRTLGFINMNAFTQRVIARCASACCDIEFYRKRRDVLCDGLKRIGYQFRRPEGGMFVFPKTPIADDRAFIDVLTEQRVLAVAGQGFSCPGYMRLSFAVDLETIERALPGFEAAFRLAQRR